MILGARTGVRAEINNGIASAIALLATAILLAVAVLSSATAQLASADDNAEGPSRSIAIAYDNSGSMIKDSTKWCSAKYSLEVLAAMLDSADTMTLYAMDESGQKLLVSGNESATQRVQVVHDADLGVADYTVHTPTQEAYDYLSNSSADEKYLIITTDGDFNGGSSIDDVQRIVDAAADQGISVIYLAIGDVGVIKSDPEKGVYVKLADSETILETMVDVANLVFGRDSLPDDSVNNSSGQVYFEVPMSRLVVFAQGENVTIGDLVTSDGDVVKGDQAVVRYSEVASPSNGKYGSGEVDTNLQGVLCTYKANMPAGECSIELEGAASIEMYYTPYVGISTLLKDANSIEYVLEPGGDNELSAGTYSVSYSFIDPFSGEIIESDLLYPAVFGMSVESGGSVASVENGKPLDIGKGDVSIVVRAEARGGARVVQGYRGIQVSAAVVPLNVDASAIPSQIPLDDVGKQSYPVTITKQDGSSLTQEEWASLEASIEDDSGIVWAAARTDDPGILSVSPQLIENDVWTTQEKVCGMAGFGAASFRVKLEAAIDAGDNMLKGIDERSVDYEPNLLSAFLNWLPLIIALLIVLYLLYKMLTKKRLPRDIKPKIEYAGRTIDLQYSKGNIKNRFSPWGPERVTISLTPKHPNERNNCTFPSKFRISSVGIVAAKRAQGKRQFIYNPETLMRFARYADQPGDFPAPDFSGLPSLPSLSEEKPTGEKGRSKRRGRRRKQTQSPRRSTSHFSFTGWGEETPSGRRREEQYTFWFKK